jgi:hypothetical protein
MDSTIEVVRDVNFWWNWWVQFAVAFGTIAVVVVALIVARYGDRLRLPPNLVITRPNRGVSHATRMRPGTTSLIKLLVDGIMYKLAICTALMRQPERRNSI